MSEDNRSFVCRCEDVTLAEVRAVVDSGLRDIEEIKRYTGLGTGPCQGKECLAALARLLANGSEIGPLPFTARPPLEEVSFAALAALSEEAVREDAK
jgi:sarcosine oxidase subunit beta